MDEFEQLERKIETATAVIDKLQRENRTLKNRLKKLEADGAKGAGWAKQRQVVRKRLSKLAEHLEALA